MRIQADKEFKSLSDRLHEDLSVKVNIPNPDEHVGDVEWLNMTLQEKFRIYYYCLLLKPIPCLMVDYLAMTTTRTMNFFPMKGDIRKFFSTHVLLRKNNLDYDRDF